MIQEEKQLLVQDLCARLPYRICVNLQNHHLVSHQYVIYDIESGWTIGLLDCAGRIQVYGAEIEDIKPYLRPMSSMTEEERIEYELLANHCIVTSIGFIHLEVAPLIDFLNKNHFDYRGLIPMGLAIEVTEENNPYKE